MKYYMNCMYHDKYIVFVAVDKKVDTKVFGKKADLDSYICSIEAKGFEKADQIECEL